MVTVSLVMLYEINYCIESLIDEIIDLIHKSQNAPVPYPTMLHSKQKCVHFCLEWSTVGYGTGAL